MHASPLWLHCLCCIGPATWPADTSILHSRAVLPPACPYAWPPNRLAPTHPPGRRGAPSGADGEHLAWVRPPSTLLLQHAPADHDATALGGTILLLSAYCVSVGLPMVDAHHVCRGCPSNARALHSDVSSMMSDHRGALALRQANAHTMLASSPGDCRGQVQWEAEESRSSPLDWAQGRAGGGGPLTC